MSEDKPKLIAYHGNPAIKASILAQLRAHYEADEIIKGVYWQHGKGCAVGCTIHSSDHAEYEPRFGIPEQLAHLEDALFEALPNDKAKEWPIRFMEAIPVGADLSIALSQFLHWLLVDPEHGVLHFADDEQGRTAIQNVADLHARRVNADEPTNEEWAAARAAAGDAAWNTARDAVWDAARDAAWVAAWAAARAAARAADWAAARVAAWAAARAADWDAAWDAARAAQAEKLLECLASAPVVEAVQS